MTSHHDTGSSGHEHRSGTTSRAGGTTGTTGPGDTVAERYRRRAAEFTRRVLAVPDGAWHAPSPCAGWSARDVLAHMLDNHREMPGYAGLTLTIDTPVERDPYGAWQQARERMQDLLQDPARARAEYTGHFGNVSIADTVDRFLGCDLIVHAWDIARATGQDETLPAHEVTAVYEQMLPLRDMLRMPGVCGPEVSVPADAPIQDRLLGLMGRRP